MTALAKHHSVTEGTTAFESMSSNYRDQVSTAGVETSRSTSNGHTGISTMTRLALSHILEDGCMASSTSRCQRSVQRFGADRAVTFWQ
jgi:hypothetical protein